MKIGTGKTIYFYGHMLSYIYTTNACDILKVLPDKVHHLQSGWICHFLKVKHQCWFFIHQHFKNWMCIVSGRMEEMASLDAGREFYCVPEHVGCHRMFLWMQSAIHRDIIIITFCICAWPYVTNSIFLTYWKQFLMHHFCSINVER